MKIIFSILIFIVHGVAHSQLLQLQPTIRFLALGDSYTIGQSVLPEESWPNQLYSRLAAAGYTSEKIQIIARTGWRTDVLAGAIATENPPADFNLVSLLIGVNDQYQGKPFASYEPAFRDLLNTAIKLAGGVIEHVFVVSIPDYAYTPYGAGNTNISQQIDQYNAVNKSVAEEYGIMYFDITPISREGINEPELVANDNLHPSALQYERWVDFMLSKLTLTLSNDALLHSKKKELIYPNPANQQLRINKDYIAANNSYKIYNQAGTLLLSGKAEDAQSGIDISELKEGTYLITFNNFSSTFLVKK
jgi:lysophospholipase L1-like esterase